MKKDSPFISLQIVSKHGELVRRVGSRKLRRIYYFIQRAEYSECLFEVSVIYQKHYCNESVPQTKANILKTLQVFFER